jgi:hypothetical protein
VPVRPVPPNDHRSPFRRLLDSAMRLGVQSAIGKLYALIGNDGVHTYTYQGVITAAGLTNDELVQLNEDTTSIALPSRDNSSIMPNGVAVRHHHGNNFRVRTIQRPVVVRTNSGTVRVTRV